MKLLRRYWGFLALIVALACWAGLIIGQFVTFVVALVLILSVGAVGYFLFQAPLSCGAIAWDGKLCRNSSSGILVGCYLRDHKWQKLRMAFVPTAWPDLNRGLWASPRQGVTAVGGLSAAVSALAALIAIIVTSN
jgi:hypothetical protein